MKVVGIIAILVIFIVMVLFFTNVWGKVNPSVSRDKALREACIAYQTCVRILERDKEYCWENYLPAKANQSFEVLKETCNDNAYAAYEYCSGNKNACIFVIPPPPVPWA